MVSAFAIVQLARGQLRYRYKDSIVIGWPTQQRFFGPHQNYSPSNCTASFHDIIIKTYSTVAREIILMGFKISMLSWPFYYYRILDRQIHHHTTHLSSSNGLLICLKRQTDNDKCLQLARLPGDRQLDLVVGQ